MGERPVFNLFIQLHLARHDQIGWVMITKATKQSLPMLPSIILTPWNSRADLKSSVGEPVSDKTNQLLRLP